VNKPQWHSVLTVYPLANGLREMYLLNSYTEYHREGTEKHREKENYDL
jgi:hypothetical protein